MRLKTLLLLPFIITGCTGNNISSEEIPSTELPTLPSSEDPASSNNDGSTSEETPLSTLPTAESLNNLRKPEPKINNETMTNITWLDFGFGRNVHVDEDMTNPEILDEEHCPFIPEVYEVLNDAADNGFCSSNASYLKSKSLEGLCEIYGNYFYEESFSQVYGEEEKELAAKIRMAKIKKYLGQFYKKTNSDKPFNDDKTYAILTELCAASYTTRYSIHIFKNYGYKDSYIEELKEVLEKDEYAGYCALFEKYGTEYIHKVTYAPRHAMYLGFSGNVTFNTFGFDQKLFENKVEELLDENGQLTLTDYSITESEYNWAEEDWKGARQISYGTWPFYNLLPEKYDLYKHRSKIEAAYRKYCAEKLEKLEKEVSELVEEQTYINDAYFKRSFDEYNSRQKPFEFDFVFGAESSLQNPQTMYQAGFTKLYMRPRINLSKEVSYDSEIIIGGKRAKVRDGDWYQINITDLYEVDSNVHFKVTPITNSNVSVTLEFVYMK